MTLKEKIKKIQTAIKEGKGGAVAEYFWDYYKLHAFVIIAVLGFIGNLAYTKLTAKDIILSGTLLNQYNILGDEPTEKMVDTFMAEQGFDTATQKVELNTSLRYSNNGDSSLNDATIQGLLAQCSGGTMDFVTGDMEAMTIFAYGDYFYDLYEVLSAEEIERYEPYFLYIDRDYQRQVDEAFENPEVLLTMLPPDMNHPETMVNPVPVLIDISETTLNSDIYLELVDTLCFGFTVNAPNPETAKEFLHYLTVNY